MRPALRSLPKTETAEYPFESDQMAADRQTASLAGLALMLGLVVVGLSLVHRLHQESQIEDCLLAGRNDCAIALMAGR